jgi:hypothetical protein
LVSHFVGVIREAETLPVDAVEKAKNFKVVAAACGFAATADGIAVGPDGLGSN